MGLHNCRCDRMWAHSCAVAFLFSTFVCSCIVPCKQLMSMDPCSSRMGAASPLLQKSFVMNAGKHDTAMEGCSLDAQKRYQSNLSLRARHLQSSSRAQEKLLQQQFSQIFRIFLDFRCTSYAISCASIAAQRTRCVADGQCSTVSHRFPDLKSGTFLVATALTT